MSQADSLRRHSAGDYRTPDGHWQIIRLSSMDNGLQRRWIIREKIGPGFMSGWFALDGDYATLREARNDLRQEMSAMTEESKTTPRLTQVQQELLAEFQSGKHPDRYVNARYRRSADVLVRHGLLKHSVVWGWYILTDAGRNCRT